MKKGLYDPHRTKQIRYLFKTGDSVEAFRLMDEYLLEYPTDSGALLYKANMLLFCEKYEEARNVIAQALILPVDESSYIYSRELLAKIELSIGDRDKAIELLETTINSSSNYCVKLRTLLSSLYLEDKKYRQATDIVTIKDFNILPLNISRAEAFLRMGYTDIALREIDAPIINDNKSEKEEDNISTLAISYSVKGEIYLKQSKYKEAIECYRKAIDLLNKPRIKYDYSVTLASIYYQIGDYFNVIAICNDLLKQSDDCRTTSIYTLLGITYIKSGNINKFLSVINDIKDDKIKNICTVQLYIAQFKFEEALKIMSDMPNEDYYVYLYKLILLFRFDKYEEYVKLYDEYKSSKYYDDKCISSSEIERMKNYMEIKRGISSYSLNSYTDRLLSQYDRDLAINHIKEHHLNSLYGLSFKDEKTVEEVFSYVESKLSSSYKNCDGIYDKYYIKVDKDFYDNKGNLIKVISVTCFADTLSIITMYPLNNFEFNENIPCVKVQRLSQIDKFNRKYGNN